MKSLLNYFKRILSINELIYCLLIYLSMYAVLLGAELVIRGISIEVLWILILLGVLSGWVLSRSKLNFWLAAIIAVSGGFILTVLHVGGVGSALIDLGGESLSYLWRLVFDGSPDASGLAFLLSVIKTRGVEVINSLGVWVSDLLIGFSVYNQISTLFSWGWIIWVFAYWFSWTTYRKEQPIWGTLPAGTLLAVLMTYTIQKRFTLALVLGAGLILIGLVNHDVRERKWKEREIKGTDTVRERVYLAVFGFALLTMTFAGIMPSIRISPIADRYEDLVYGTEGTEIDDSGSSGSLEIGDYNSDLYSVKRFAGLPRQKLIGSGPELAKRVVMIVSYPATSFADTDLPVAARYWRSYTYDGYNGEGWQSSPTVEVSYQPGQEIIGVYSDSMEIITQEFRLGNAVRGTLFSAGPPVTVDHEALVSWRTLVEAGSNGDSQIVGMEDIFAVKQDSILYQVRSLVPRVSDDDLRSAEGEFPDWINSRYLDLPDTVPQRVLDLAAEVAESQTNRFDKAKAIEIFLRSYPYTLELEAPPVGRDVADYFLFDLQTGYCDYYATAMVVLARAIGLPARAVVGYVGGQYDRENDYYLVTEADAHTWVEIYFSGYGWIPFEPTATRSLIEDEVPLPLPPELMNLPQPVEAEERTIFPWWQTGVGLVLFAAAGLGAWNIADINRLRSMDANSLALTLYKRLYRFGRWMDLGHRKTDTQYEFDEKLVSAVKELADKPRHAKRLGSAVHEINQLTEYAVQANFSPIVLDQILNERIVKIWINLRKKLSFMVWNILQKSLADKLVFWESPGSELELIGDGVADGTS